MCTVAFASRRQAKALLPDARARIIGDAASAANAQGSTRLPALARTRTSNLLCTCVSIRERDRVARQKNVPQFIPPVNQKRIIRAEVATTCAIAVCSRTSFQVSTWGNEAVRAVNRRVNAEVRNRFQPPCEAWQKQRSSQTQQRSAGRINADRKRHSRADPAWADQPSQDSLAPAQDINDCATSSASSDPAVVFKYTTAM